MYLKALEIQGFKSFPDKTVLNFGEDITAIVGPNGSGKSNISDAIRWVMGEQSTKNLRGAKMEDVIFGGTAKRPQLGFAQVTLVLDNTGHIFPAIEESEVAVTRRYYRSGESEYYINRQSVRLKDVMELFMDTGMGKEGYSIIGQGRIDEILSTKSGDRREIFEEAAGISKYRHRKEESERKLEHTDENLVRINDKISELELQLDPLRNQAEKAKKYLILRDELRVLEISVWLTNLDNLKVNARKLEADFHAAEEARDDARTKLDALYAEGEQYAAKMQEKDVEAERIRAGVSELDGQISEQESAVAVLHSTIAHHQENMERLEREFSQQDVRAGNLQRQIKEAGVRIAESKKKRESLNVELDNLLRQAKEASAKAGDARAEAEALRGREAIAVAAAADAKVVNSAVEAENSQLIERREAVLREQKDTHGQLEETAKAVQEGRRDLENARNQSAATANVISGYRLQMEERKKRAAAANEKKMQLTMSVGALKNRIHLLTEMEREYEGFSKAVRMVMQAKNSLRGVCGPVGNLARTEQAYAIAIEIALGGGVQNIVVDREEDAKTAIRYLKQRDGGRATFLPLSTIHGEELHDSSLKNEYGYVGIASRLATFDPEYRNIFQYLLGRTVVVEDLDCGISMARKYRNRFRIVTLDGQVINRGGSMTGGSVSQHAGVLSRAAELEKLTGRAGTLRQELDHAVREADDLSRELKASGYELETAQTQQRQAEDEVLRLEGHTSHLDSLSGGLQKTFAHLSDELKSLNERLAENQERAGEADAVIAAQEKAAAEYRAQAEEKLSGQSDFLTHSGELSDAITARKSEIAALDAEKDATSRNLADLHRLNEQMSGDRAARERQAAEYRQKIASARGETEQHKQKITELKNQGQAFQNQLAGLNQEKIALEAERTAKNKAGQEMNENLLNMERAVSKLEQKISEGSMEEKQILDRLWERYELSHSDAQAQRIELESMAKASRRIGELKRDISALGTPNIGAIEEFERVNTRYTYLTDQRDDVEKAKGELEGVIREITDQMTKIFAQQFQLLSETFQSTFTDLFGGGQATLQLEDENDILNCGIDIKAQPPGKTLKNISLLSGGEKAFVAIALYFSILKVHPTPFCVMDEIEAALDDINVTRYARYMRRLADKTQFIVITHRRGMMEEADVLYGVTMQEQGVSKILMMNLNEMAKNLKIK